ncbi:5-oxoprolinase, HyuA-like domain / 5-oxoprolinase, HyuB-like domain [hydrothermal vent metagenome]|uniref:5-oxoprolinase, HyuA-like domain / 5-oxoprolinase, HyuB-like domain n=1 Tax=hydrothermal vent metagenome TaxID=652676 RepID=A0A3B0R8I4_9ZZZZ
MKQGWAFWIDRGGTFTDILGKDPSGVLHSHKLLSVNPDMYEDSAIAGIWHLLGLQPDQPLPEGLVSQVRMGTTLATNALLERKHAPTLLLTTKGFADSLHIGNQMRPDIFALDIAQTEPLFQEVIEIDERIGADDSIITPLDPKPLAKQLRRARKRGCISVAICLVHGYRVPVHEDILAQLAKETGFAHISTSRVNPLVKFVPRCSTLVVDACLTPVLRDGIAGFRQKLKNVDLFFMKSSGGLTAGDSFSGRDAVLSGPAGGVIGMAGTAASSGYDKVIGFDMGGTSTDVSRVSGPERQIRNLCSLQGVVLRADMLDIHTIAAGGGSVLKVENGRAQVGPQSAGAMPGPACYGRGGPATITDANLILGRIDPSGFASVFGSDGKAGLDLDAATARMTELAKQLNEPDLAVAAAGFLEIATENMARAVHAITVQQGEDPGQYALSSFGGAGGQMAIFVAEKLGIGTVLVHPQASLLSALGMGLAVPEANRSAALGMAFDADSLAIAQAKAKQLLAQANEELAPVAGPNTTQDMQMQIDLRVQGSDTAIRVKLTNIDEMQQLFAERHRRLFGFYAADANLVMDGLHLRVRAVPLNQPEPVQSGATKPKTKPLGERAVWLDGTWQQLPVWRAQDVRPGQNLQGPALILQPHSQILLKPGWQANMDAHGMLVLRGAAAKAAKIAPHPVNLVQLELFNRRFMGVAEQMGRVLERTAHSVNMKERLDFSCAVFDGAGNLVANAPHMPVHLGSMSDSVRAVLRAHPSLAAGDVVALNSPYSGGTHIPDITLVEPVFDADGKRIFIVAARGHHADIGGIQPGSMPPFSTDISEEGVQFEAIKIAKNGQFDEKLVRQILGQGRWPARNPDQNIADLKAQMAACQCGITALASMITQHGADLVAAYMRHIQDNAEEAVRQVIARLSDGVAEINMDCGAVIKVGIKLDHAARAARIDFAGTSAVLANNFNAPASVARAAVIYVFRCLANVDIPLNEGCLAPLDIHIPKQSLLDPVYPAAVVAGNVETSQHIVDALFLATNALAAAQGTMNNFTFGNAQQQYYETICGGAGASPNADGASAVHTHMTNSAMTDVEVLEQRFAVRLQAHEIRRGSGGDGYYRGGDGSRRILTFLQAMDVALLSSRRHTLPPGLDGAEWGTSGCQRWIRADGGVEELDGCFQIKVQAGDSIEIETPGGGGFGKE